MQQPCQQQPWGRALPTRSARTTHLGGGLRPRGGGGGEQAAREGRRRGRGRRRRGRGKGLAGAHGRRSGGRCRGGSRQVQAEVGRQGSDDVCHAAAAGVCGRRRRCRRLHWRAGLTQVPAQRGQQRQAAGKLVLGGGGAQRDDAGGAVVCSSRRQLQLGNLVCQRRAPAKGCAHEGRRNACTRCCTRGRCRRRRQRSGEGGSRQGLRKLHRQRRRQHRRRIYRCRRRRCCAGIDCRRCNRQGLIRRLGWRSRFSRLGSRSRFGLSCLCICRCRVLSCVLATPAAPCATCCLAGIARHLLCCLRLRALLGCGTALFAAAGALLAALLAGTCCLASGTSSSRRWRCCAAGLLLSLLLAAAALTLAGLVASVARRRRLRRRRRLVRHASKHGLPRDTWLDHTGLQRRRCRRRGLGRRGRRRRRRSLLLRRFALAAGCLAGMQRRCPPLVLALPTRALALLLSRGLLLVCGSGRRRRRLGGRVCLWRGWLLGCICWLLCCWLLLGRWRGRRLHRLHLRCTCRRQPVGLGPRKRAARCCRRVTRRLGCGTSLILTALHDAPRGASGVSNAHLSTRLPNVCRQQQCPWSPLLLASCTTPRAIPSCRSSMPRSPCAAATAPARARAAARAPAGCAAAPAAAAGTALGLGP